MYTKLAIILVVALLFVSCKYDDGYRIEGNKVVYEHQWNEGYGTKISELNADVATFEILGNDNVSWAKDKDKVWWGYMEFNNMDPKTFKALTISMAKDKNKVICGNRIMKEANPAEFEIRTFVNKVGYEYIYGVDKSAAYLCDREPNGYLHIPSQSIDSFQQLEDGFYKDKENISWLGSLLPDVNVSSFKVLAQGYASDEKHIYFHNKIIHGADPSTFRVTGIYEGQDKDNIYSMERRIGPLIKKEL